MASNSPRFRKLSITEGFGNIESIVVDFRQKQAAARKPMGPREGRLHAAIRRLQYKAMP